MKFKNKYHRRFTYFHPPTPSRVFNFGFLNFKSFILRYISFKIKTKKTIFAETIEFNGWLASDYLRHFPRWF